MAGRTTKGFLLIRVEDNANTASEGLKWKGISGRCELLNAVAYKDFTLQCGSGQWWWWRERSPEMAATSRG